MGILAMKQEAAKEMPGSGAWSNGKCIAIKYCESSFKYLDSIDMKILFNLFTQSQHKAKAVCNAVQCIFNVLDCLQLARP